MEVFKVVETVLNRLYASVPGADDAAKDKAIQVEIDRVRDRYADFNSEDLLGFERSEVRFAYLRQYVTSHSNILSDVLGKVRDFADVFKREKVNISCIGGGPGSDLLGVLKYCKKAALSPALKLRIFDVEPSWSEAWDEVVDDVDWSARLISSYTPLDATQPKTWSYQQEYLKSDVFTMLYFLSELYSRRASAEGYLDHLFSQARQGSYFVIVDIQHSTIRSWVDRLIARHSHKVIYSKDEKAYLPREEQQTDLGDWGTRFSEVKLTAKVFVRVTQKQ